MRVSVILLIQVTVINTIKRCKETLLKSWCGVSLNSGHIIEDSFLCRKRFASKVIAAIWGSVRKTLTPPVSQNNSSVSCRKSPRVWSSMFPYNVCVWVRRRVLDGEQVTGRLVRLYLGFLPLSLQDRSLQENDLFGGQTSVAGGGEDRK